MSGQEGDAAARRDLGHKVLQACRKQRITLKQLADKAGYDEKTIRNVTKGEKTRIGTLENICEVLGIDLYGVKIRASEDSTSLSSEVHGGYSKSHYEDYVGLFVAYRRSFTFPENILRSVYEFAWSDEKSCLIFREMQVYQSTDLNKTIDYSQEGEIFISNAVNLLHLLTTHKGAVRLITLTRMKVNDMTLRGAVLTQAQGEFYFQPSVSPIYFQKANTGITAEMLRDQVGPVRPSDAEYDTIHRTLCHVQQKVAIFGVVPLAHDGRGAVIAA